MSSGRADDEHEASVGLPTSWSALIPDVPAALRASRRDPWLWVGIACALAFVVLTALVMRGGEFAIDESVTAAVRGLDVPTVFWELCSFLGGWQMRLVIGVALVLAAVLAGRVRLAVIVAIVLITAPVFMEVMKAIVDRPRPPDPLVETSSASFPSGHTLDSTVTYGVLALVAWRSGLPAAVRWAVLVVGIAIPLLTGVSRIALGAHWPTDVIGGWLAGIAFVAGAAVLIKAGGAMERDPAPPVARPSRPRGSPPDAAGG